MDENPSEPSSSPIVSRLPPIITEEPIERIRNFYVTSKDADPANGGFGFTTDCKGCSAIINGKRPVAHSHECRLKNHGAGPEQPEDCSKSEAYDE